jgi:hypothetical protein
MTSAPLLVHYWPAASLERRRTMLAGKRHA